MDGTHRPSWLSFSRDGVIFLLLSLFDLLIHMDYSAASLALVPIGLDVCRDLNTLQWVLSAYVLAWGAFVIPAGKAVQIWGHRLILLVGIGLFLAGSLLAGIAQSSLILILGRIGQGMGGALISPAITGFLIDRAPLKTRPFLMGILGGIAGFGMAIGPLLGGVIIDLLSWRWIFLINLPIGLCLWLCIYIFLPRRRQNGIKTTGLNPSVERGERGQKSPYRQLFVGRLSLLVFGVVLTIIALNQWEIWGWTDWRLLTMMAVGVMVIASFVRLDAAARQKIFPHVLFKKPVFIVATIILFLNSYLFSAILTLPVLFLQNMANKSSDVVGFLFFPMCLAMGVLSPVGGRLSNHIRPLAIVMVGMGLAVAGTCWIGMWDGHTSHLTIIGTLALVGAGLGLSYPVLQSTLIHHGAQKTMPLVIGFYSFMTLLGDTLGVIIPTSSLVFLSRNHAEKIVEATMAPALYERLLASLGSVAQNSPRPFEGLEDMLLAQRQICYQYGFSATLWLSCGVIAVILGVCFVVQRRQSLQNHGSGTV